MEPKEIIERLRRKEKKRRKREFRLILALMMLFAGTLALEINFSGIGQKLPFVNSILFFALININIILIGLLVFLVFRNIIKLVWERIHGVLGARLKTKLVVVFVSFTIIPTILLFTVSVFYINNSFGRWFNVRISEALQGALTVQNNYYQDRRDQAFLIGARISEEISARRLLSKTKRDRLQKKLQDDRSGFQLDSIEVFSSLEGSGIATVNLDVKQRAFPPLEQQFLKEGFLGRQASIVQRLKEGDLIRCIMPIYDVQRKNVISALVISSFISSDITSKVALIGSTYNEYREVKPIKRSLKTIYITILLLMVLLIVFAAIWLGFHVARELTIPIQRLVEGTEEVAKGNLDVRIDHQGKDELSMLVGSFNQMTRDLKESQEKLAKVQRMAAWREVARRIAHEIKNPLTPIKLSAQRLRRKYLSSTDSVFDECTHMIITQVDELKQLVDEFSSFSKLPEANPKPCYLEKIVREAITIYQEAHSKIQFSFSLAPNLPKMELDREQIKRVLINLFDNAIAAMEGKGRVTVFVRYNSTLQFVVLEISDSGVGISDEVRSRLFEPYFSTKKEGTGLGLAIVRKIISDHHGYIRVANNYPKGTKFLIELPIKSSTVVELKKDVTYEQTRIDS